MRKWLPVLLLVIVLLLGACSAEKKENVAAEPEDTEVAGDDVVEEDAESEEDVASEEVDSEEGTSEEEDSEVAGDAVEEDAPVVVADESWSGRWIHEAYPEVYGALVIFDETDEGFSFSLRISTTHVAELPMGYAVKDGNTATLVNDEQGCELVLHKDGGMIRSEQKSNGCMHYHGAGISLESTFTNDGILLIDENFPELLKQGKFSVDSYALGTDYETIVAEIGEAVATQSSGGAILKLHPPILYGIDYMTESGPVYALESYMVDPLRPEDIKAVMGVPVSEDISEMDGTYIMYYTIEDKYKVFLKFDPESKLLMNIMMAEL